MDFWPKPILQWIQSFHGLALCYFGSGPDCDQINAFFHLSVSHPCNGMIIGVANDRVIGELSDLIHRRS